MFHNDGLIRPDGRENDALRVVSLTPHAVKHPLGSVLVAFGDTRVLCCASVQERVPMHQVAKGEGWVTAEYAMLPASTHTRSEREGVKGKQGGRTLEIQRLIGRALRASIDLKALGARTVVLDCDVLQADGGTRTASITGAYVALALAMGRLVREGVLEVSPLRSQVAAVSVGVWGPHVLLDLNYEEDSSCEVDLNLVMTGGDALVEVQGTAEGQPFSRARLDELLELGTWGIKALLDHQANALKEQGLSPLGQPLGNTSR